MSFQEDKKILVEYFTKPEQEIYNNEQELENFFLFMDKMEEKAIDNAQYFALLADAYMMVGYTAKAKEAFSKIYNPKNKKDIKKLMNYERAKAKPIIRPSQRAKELPPFKYVHKHMMKNQFIISEECSCSICRKKPTALYVGIAYSDSSEEITFINQKEKFCADCIFKGTAAKTQNLKFNSPGLEECSVIDSEKREELLYRTPGCSKEFDFNEDIWPVCCGDFCCYTGLDNTYEEIFHFQCTHCGKEIIWTKET